MVFYNGAVLQILSAMVFLNQRYPVPNMQISLELTTAELAMIYLRLLKL